MRKIVAFISSAMVLALAAIVLASCGGGAEPTSTPTPPPAYPVTVIDMLGRTVRLEARPTRIVTISPTATETLYSIGGTAVGRDTSSRYPSEVQGLPTVGGAYSPSIETIASLQPDLILAEALTQAHLLAALQQIGVPVIVVRATSLDDVEKSLTLLGQALDKNDTAKNTINNIRARVQNAQGLVPAPKSVLIFIYDAERNIYAAKPESYPGAVASLLNLTNLAAGLPESGPYPGFSLFSPEQALIANPDVVFTISPAPPPAPSLSQILPAVPGFSQMGAVRSGRVKELDPVLFLQAQGPRIADAVEELARLVQEAAP